MDEKSKPRVLSIRVDRRDFNRLNELLPFGLKEKVYGQLTADLIAALEHDQDSVLAYIHRRHGGKPAEPFFRGVQKSEQLI